MNRWAALLAGAAMTISAPAAAQEAIGDWQGTLDAGGQKLRLVFHVAQGPDGKLTGTIDSLDQGAFGIPLGDVVLESDRLTIAVPPVSGSYAGGSCDRICPRPSALSPAAAHRRFRPRPARPA